jgi:hypothetical protein
LQFRNVSLEAISLTTPINECNGDVTPTILEACRPAFYGCNFGSGASNCTTTVSDLLCYPEPNFPGPKYFLCR